MSRAMSFFGPNRNTLRIFLCTLAVLLRVSSGWAAAPEIRIDPTSISFTQEETAAKIEAVSETSASSDGVTIKTVFRADQLKLQQKDGCWQVALEGAELPEDAPGAPWLPAMHINALIPAGARVKRVDVSADEVLIADNVAVCPVQPPAPLSRPAPAPTPKDPGAFSRAVKVPEELAVVTGHHTLRGYTYASIRINPVRYNPALRELYLALGLDIVLEYGQQRKTAISPAGNRSVFKKMLRKILVNGDMLAVEGFEPEAPLVAALADPVDYLIITSSELATAFQELAEHRADHSKLQTEIVTVESIYADSNYDGVDSQEEIRNCIKDYVDNRGTVYVVLGGDDAVVPDRDCYAKVISSIDYIEPNMPTDLYYAGLDGTWDEDGDGIYGEANTEVGDEGDLVPDVIVGRIPVRSADQALSYIQKIIEYENYPPPAEFKEKFLILGDLLWDSYTGDSRPTDTLNDGFSPFRDHSPVSDAEMWLRRMFRDGIQPAWGEILPEYFFDTLTSWDTTVAGDYSQNYATVAARFNEGWQNIFFGTHGGETVWGLENGSFDSYRASNLSARTTIVYTMACLTGHFDGSPDPSLSEAFLRNPHGGALAYFGCSRYGWGSPDYPPAEDTSKGGTSMAYAYGFYKEMLTSGEDSLGFIFSTHKANLAASSMSYGSYRWVQFGLNYQGDPAFNLTDSVMAEYFTIYNDGDGDLVISSLTKRDGDPWFSWSPQAPFTIPPGGSELVTVSVDWDLAPTRDDDQIRVQSNDSDENLYTVGVYLNPCLAPPGGIYYPQSDCDGDFSISWQSVSGAAGYVLERARDDIFSSDIMEIYRGAGTTYQQTGLADGAYYYRVQAVNDTCSSDWNQGGKVGTGIAPATPEFFVYPPSDCDGSFSISWQSVSGAAGYVLERARDPVFSVGVTEFNYGQDETEHKETGLANNVYYYRVRAVSPYCDSEWRTGSGVVVSVPATPYFTFYPSSDCDGDFSIGWQPIGGATSYVLQRARDENFTVDVTEVLNEPAIVYNETGLANGVYYYRLRAVNDFCEGEWRSGGGIVVSVLAVPGAIAYPTSDCDGGFTVSWSSVSGATSYVLQRARDENFSVEVTEVLDELAIVYNETGLANDSYYYRVQAVNGYCGSAWRSGDEVAVGGDPEIQYVSAEDCSGACPCRASINSAIESAGSAGIIRVMGSTYIENVVLGLPKTLEFEGLDPSYSTPSTAIIAGTMTLSSGEMSFARGVCVLSSSPPP